MRFHSVRNVLELIPLNEEEFGIAVRDGDMSAELLGSIAGLSAYVRKQLEEHGEAQRCDVPTDH